MPGGMALHDRGDSFFTSLIDENHCAPPAAFESNATPSPSVAMSSHALPQASMPFNMSSIAPRKLNEHMPSVPQSGARMTTPSALNEGELGMSTTHVVRPDRHALPGEMEIHIHGIPATGAKSRVETQIRMRMELVTRSTNEGDGSAAWDRIGSFTHVKVPPLSGTKRKSKKYKKTVPGDSVLFMEANVINATPPHAQVYVCNNCRERERKRADRKKSKKLYSSAAPTEEEVRALGIDVDAPNALELAMERMGEEERKHAVLFNCGDYIDFHDGEAIISTRITCYCRHHREKVGFRIVFTLRNQLGEFVATGSTPPIMIMDDHKSVTQTSAMPRPARQLEANRGASDFEERHASRSLSPQDPHPSLAGDGPARARDRAKPYDDRRRARGSRDSTSNPPVDASSASFMLDPSRHFLWNSMMMQGGTPDAPNATLAQPMSDATTAAPGATSPLSGVGSMQLLTAPLPSELLGSSSTATDMSFEPLFSTQTSAQLPEQRSDSLAPMSDAPQPQDHEPRITKLIPAEGPTTGGIEITVLGENFVEGLQCVFGDTPCSYTRVWASTTLVCVLPPHFRPGPVIVTLQRSATDPAPVIANQPLQLFTYIDATDRALMELALQVVGLQMTGQMASARDIAMRIVNSSQNGDGNSGAGAGGAGSVPQNQASGYAPDVSSLLAHGLRLCGTHNSARPSVQDSIMGFLSLLDAPMDDAARPSRRALPLPAIHACNQRGQTLLHLAVVHNFHRLAQDLLRRGCPVNAQDANGYTALHFAALNGSLLTTRILLEHGASPYIANAGGLTPIDVARNAEMVDTEHALAEYIAETQDLAGFSDATDSEEDEEDIEVDEERTPTHLPRAVFDEEASDAESDAASDASSDAAISFAELAALYQAKQKAPPAESPRSPWHFGLLRRWSPGQTDDEKRKDDDPALSTVATPTTATPLSPSQILSPPPTYDEATLDDESGTSRHVFGEKLVTNADDPSRLRRLLHLEAPVRQAVKARRSMGTEMRQRWRSSRERRAAKEEGNEATAVVRPRPGVYDDRMLLWFWIPAMVSVFLVTVAIHYGPDVYHSMPLGRIFTQST
ncbi:hypothetical protein MBRA1_000488 [Malassezia brasiliensis]|uniref:IPT/TIG domain-containing protein n=1 Tax=Malassezia brasiliensis TaxID=1821822 RepID=A0AAF0DR22_9BASI|nr:hypothetical protein MBRA1_000488 [Malassezia brasiliensis]